MSAERRQAILDAALEVFSERGYAGARLDDVALKAGVAKGTLYLYFEDKEALFEQLLLSLTGPVLDHVQGLAARPDRTAPEILSDILDLIQREIIGSKRRRLVRLVLSEGPRFPTIAEFYYRNVILRGREAIRGIVERGVARGELPNDALARFPQLFFAPVLLAEAWESLFSRFEKLDVAAMLAEHKKFIAGVRQGLGKPGVEQ